MKYILFFVCTAAITFNFGCVTTSKTKCTAAVVHSPTEYDVCVGDKQVQTGDRVAFFKERCTPQTRGNSRKCYKEKVGEGLVIKTLDEHLSTIKLDSEFELTEQMTIEKR